MTEREKMLAGVQILTAYHPTDARERTSVNDKGFEFWKTQSKLVTIGDDVWVGAGSVVTRSIPKNVIAFGNPCKVIRENI